MWTIKIRNPWIDALRAFAAVSVLTMHCIWLGGLSNLPAVLHGWFYNGWLGVDLFLVISGYVISKTLLDQKDIHKEPNRNFWRNRIFRIYPLYLFISIFFLFAIDASALRGDAAWWQALTHLTMSHGFFPNTASSINAVSWTLSLEMQLYVLGFLLFKFISNFKNLLFAFAVVLVVTLIYRIVVYTNFYDPAVADSNMASHLITQIVGLADGFVLGCLLARAEYEPKLKLWFQKNWFKALAFGLAVLIVLVTAMQFRTLGYWETWHYPVLFRSATAIGFVMILAGCVFSPPRLQIWCPKFLSYMGVISYGIYLWHLPMLILIDRFPLSPIQLFVAVLLCSILLAWFSHEFLERPFNRYAHRNMR